jgi:N-acetylmuramoyl-L-alanine amidase
MGGRGLRIVVAVVALAVIGMGSTPSAASAATDPIASVRVDGSPFYPNGDGVRDSVGLTVRLNRTVGLSVEVIDFDGGTVKTLLSGATRDAGMYTLRWKGRDSSLHVVPDGPYRFRVTAASQGSTWTRLALFTKAPKVIYPVRPHAIVVAVDPGHGDVYSEPGRQAADGTREAVINLDIGLRLRDMLEGAGIRTTISRTTDQGANQPDEWDRNGDGEVGYADELQARCDIANVGRADLFIAIHNNWADNTDIHGTATYYWPERPFAAQSLALAQAVQAGIVKRLAAYQSADWRPRDRGLRTYDYFVLYQYNPPRQVRPTGMPAVLSEGLFYSNPGDLAMLKRPRVRQSMAAGYYDAIQAYLAQRTTAVGYSALTDPGSAVAGGTVGYQIRVVNKGMHGASGWRLQARYVPAVTLYDGSPELGKLFGSVTLPTLARGARTTVNLGVPAPPAGDWLVKFDVVRGDGSRLSDLGSPMLQRRLLVSAAP